MRNALTLRPTLYMFDLRKIADQTNTLADIRAFERFTKRFTHSWLKMLYNKHLVSVSGCSTKNPLFQTTLESEARLSQLISEEFLAG